MGDLPIADWDWASVWLCAGESVGVCETCCPEQPKAESKSIEAIAIASTRFIKKLLSNFV
jgi:hypothetical protein